MADVPDIESFFAINYQIVCGSNIDADGFNKILLRGHFGRLLSKSRVGT